MAGGAGSQMLLGIKLTLDSGGVVTGAALAEGALTKVQTKANQTASNVKKSANDMGEALQNAMQLGAVGAAAIGIGNTIQQKFLKPATDQAKTYQASMSLLQKTAKASGEQMKQYGDIALETGLKTQWSPQDTVEALQLLKQNALEDKQAFEALQPVLDLATGSKGIVGLKESAGLAVSLLNKFRHTGDDVTLMMDTLANATRESSLEFGDLSQFLNSTRTAAMEMKLGTAEVMALGGAMRSSGMSSAEAGQSLNGFVRTLLGSEKVIQRFLLRQKMTREQFNRLGVEDITKGRGAFHVRAFKELGIELFNTAGKLRKPTDIIYELLKRLEGLTGESEKKMLTTVGAAFDQQAKAMLMTLVNLERNGKKGSEAFLEMVKVMGKGEGATRDFAEGIENTQMGLEKFIEGTIETTQIALGQHLLPFMNTFMFSMRQVANAFLEIITANPAVAKALGVTAFLLMAVAKAAGFVILGLAGVMTWTYLSRTGLTLMAVASKAAAAGMAMLKAAMWPIIGVVAGIIGVFALAVLAFKAWKHIWSEDAGILATHVRIMFEKIQMVWRGVKEFWDGEGSLDFKQKLMDWGLWGMVKSIVNAKDRIVLVLGGIWEGLKTMLIPIFAVVRGVGFVIVGLAVGFGKLAEKLGMLDTGPISSSWRTFGKILGYFVGVILTAFITKTTFLALIALPKMVMQMVLWIFSTGVLIKKKLVLMATALKGFALLVYNLAFKWIVVLVAKMWAWVAATTGLTLAKLKLVAVTALWVIGYIALAAAVLLVGAVLGALVAKLAVVIVELVEAGLAATKGFRDGVVEGVTSVINWFAALPGKIAATGRSLMNTFLTSLRDGWESVKSWFNGIWEWIRGGFNRSDAKHGPLSDISGAGRSLLKTFAQGADAETPALQASIHRSLGVAAVEANAAPMGAGGGTTVSKGPTTITIQKMEFHVAGTKPEQLDDVAQQILERVRSAIDDDQEVSFA